MCEEEEEEGGGGRVIKMRDDKKQEKISRRVCTISRNSLSLSHTHEEVSGK